MGRGEVQREMRITAAVIAQRPAEWAAAGSHGRFEMGPVVRTEPGRRWLAGLLAMRAAARQFTQEGLATRLTLVTTTALVPGKKAAMRGWRGRQIPPAPRITRRLRHNMTLLGTGGTRAAALIVPICTALRMALAGPCR